MISSTQTAKYLEYGLLIVIPSVIFGVIAFKGGIFSPLIVLGLGIVPLLIYFGNKLDGAAILVFMLLAMPVLEESEGITPIEVPFFAFAALMTLYVVTEIISGRIHLEHVLDKLFLFLLILMPYAVVLGVLNGAAIYSAVAETTYFFGILLYFPLRQHLHKKNFQIALGVIVFLFIGYVLIRNFYYYREIIAQAVLPWQAEKARVAANEFVVLLGCCLALSAAAVVKTRFKQFLFTGLFIALLGGLILTQSRGYWLAFFFGAIAIFFVINRSGKKRILLTALVLSSGAFLIATLFLSDMLDLVLKGLALRFQSLGTGELDISLRDRLYESLTVFELSLHNPITGYGFGYTFTRHALFSKVFVQTSYVHNGYLAAWFKMGLPGLITIITLWVMNIRYSIKLYKQSNNTRHKIVALTIIGTIIGVIFVNNTSPQVLLFEQWIFVTLFSAYLSTHLNAETHE